MPTWLRRRSAWVLGVVLLPLALAGCGADEPSPELRGRYDANGRAQFAVEPRSDLPNLVLVVIDTLRHDALPLGADAHSDARMPHLASLASRGVAFSNAVAPAPWTLPSVTSLLTGLQPSAHGLHTPHSQVHLVREITTWAEILSTTYGYDTLACTAGPWFSGSGESVLQGFHHTQDGFSLRNTERELESWARMRNPHRPFFLVLHTFDAHDPVGEANHPWLGKTLPDVRSDPLLFGPRADPAEIFRRGYLDSGVILALREELGTAEFVRITHRYSNAGYAAAPRPDMAAELADAYWEGVRWTDGLLGNTTAYLERQGLLENTLLVVAGDHGEGFGEHGSLAHGRLLYDELTRVPLVLLGPAPFDGGRVVTSSVGLVDVLPTFFDWAGLEPKVPREGQSVLPLLGDDTRCRPVVSEERLSYLNTGEAQDAIRMSVRTEQWKYIVTYDMQTGAVREEAYDLLIDPDEIDDLAEGTGRLPADLVFDDCFCEAVQCVRRRVWREQAQGAESAAHIPYGASNRGPKTPAPSPCGAGVQ